VVNQPGGSFTLQDALTSISVIDLQNTTFNANGFNVTAVGFRTDNAGTVTCTVNMGSGTWTLTGNNTSSGFGAVWRSANNSSTVINAGSSTLKFTDATATAKQVFGNSSTVTFNILWFNNSGSGALQFANNFAFNELRMDSNTSVQFTAGVTYTAASWTFGSGVTIGSSTAANHTLAKSGGGRVQVNGASISRSTATPANTFYAANSTDGGNNSGWIFGAFVSIDTASYAFAASSVGLSKTWRVSISPAAYAFAAGAWTLNDLYRDPLYVVTGGGRARSVSGGTRTRIVSKPGSPS
jgi:hypothetical protein